MRKAKFEEFVNLKIGKKSIKEYALKFTQLPSYALELVYNIKVNMRKFTFGLLNDLVLECKGAILKKDMDISRLVVYM